MKNYKLPTFPLWISLGILIGIFFPHLMSHVDNHFGFYQFLTNLILVGVTASYVWLTYKMLKTQNKQLSIITKYIIVPDITKIDRNSAFEFYCNIQNASMYTAFDIKIYVMLVNSSKNNFNYFIGDEYLSVIKPYETIEIEVRENVNYVFLSDEPPHDLEELLKKSYYPNKVKSYFMKKKLFIDDDPFAGVTPGYFFIVVEFTTLYGETKFVAREFTLTDDTPPITQDVIISREVVFL